MTPKSKKLDKTKLITKIQMLLQDSLVKTQEDIRLALQQEGISVNQVMISRVLHKIGAIKMHSENRVVYRLPTESVPVSAKNSLGQLILTISHNEYVIVVLTTPGSAQLVGRLLDQHKQELGILGTVAGDDTILIAPKTIKQMEKVTEKISELLLK